MLLVEITITDALLDGQGGLKEILAILEAEELGLLFYMINDHPESRKESIFLSNNGMMLDVRSVISVQIVEDSEEDEGGGGEEIEPTPVDIHHPQTVEALKAWQGVGDPH